MSKRVKAATYDKFSGDELADAIGKATSRYINQRKDGSWSTDVVAEGAIQKKPTRPKRSKAT